MKIKQEYIDTMVSDPLTSKIIWCREIPETLYQYYYDHGHSNLFEDEVRRYPNNFKDLKDLDWVDCTPDEPVKTKKGIEILPPEV